jgi:hypothetical protein
MDFGDSFGGFWRAGGLGRWKPGKLEIWGAVEAEFGSAKRPLLLAVHFKGKLTD